MARTSKLTDAQWHDIEKRMLAGEKAAILAKEYDIDRAQITRKITPSVRNVKTVANQLLNAESAFKQLPITQQIATLSLMDELRSISTNLASAAKYGAVNANILSGMANQQLNTVTEENLMTGEGMIALKTVSALQDMANEASKVPLGLLSANKDQMQKITNPQNSDLREMTDEELFAIASRGS